MRAAAASAVAGGTRSIALDAAAKADAKLKFAQAAIDQYRELEKKGYGKKDFGFVYQSIHKNGEI